MSVSRVAYTLIAALVVIMWPFIFYVTLRIFPPGAVCQEIKCGQSVDCSLCDLMTVMSFTVRLARYSILSVLFPSIVAIALLVWGIRLRSWGRTVFAGFLLLTAGSVAFWGHFSSLFIAL